jgi:hypothetical protein
MKGAKRLRIRIEDQYNPFERHPAAQKFTIYDEFNPLLFARMLAKIAHSFAIAEYGFGSFPSLLAHSDEVGRLYRLKPAGDSDDPGHLFRRALMSTWSSGQLAGSSSSF